MPRLSVLLPVYNAQAFLAEAIDSILGQTFTDFEFIILDDGSSDSSPEIIQAYGDPRIRFYRNDQNLGISQTLNRGIALATTEVIARMDADDRSHPSRLQQQYDYLVAHPECAMIACWVRIIDAEGRFLRQDAFDCAYYYYNLTFICWIYHPTVMYRKAAVTQVGGYKEAYSEDFELFWQLARQFSIATLPQVLLDYRETNQSLHQVVKKQEYYYAQQTQVQRNIRYYTGPELVLSTAELRCLQHDFAPMLASGSVGSILILLQKLEVITAGVMSKPNLNLDQHAVRAAAAYKKSFITSFFARHLPQPKGVWLLLRLGQFRLILWEFLRL
ncbi:glycosyltransferase family 2 protein [Hymenobacter sp. HD11105]